MQLLSEITIPRNEGRQAVIQLLIGDLSAIPKEHAVDILVVSAFPNDYMALQGSLFLALQNQGLSVQALSEKKEVDLITQLGCWLSAPLSAAQKNKFNFKRILCFEPQRHSTEPQTIVGNIFRCINTFAFDEENDEIAMPVLATGYQRVPMEKMLPALLDNAVFWLQNGLPLKNIKLVLYRQEQAEKALPIFKSAKAAIEQSRQHPKTIVASPAPSFSPRSPDTIPGPGSDEQTGSWEHGKQPSEIPEKPAPMYDLFISYSHKQTDEVHQFVKAIQQKQTGLNIFYDRTSIPPGGLWIKKISDAIQHSKSVVCILTPEYSKSDVCWDEFQCARVMELRTKKNIIKTIHFITDADMPPMFAIYSYIDCTEGDVLKLRNSIDQLFIEHLHK